MDIYKLKDEVPEERRRRGRSSSAGCAKERNGMNGGTSGVLRITDLKAGVKNPERVNVYVNGEFVLSLDVAQVVDFKVKVGRVVTNEELSELQQASEYGKLYQRTLEWVLMRPRSVREAKDYLFRKLRNTFRGPSATNEERGSEVSPVTTGGHERVREEYAEFSEDIVKKLIEKGYLDDERFAEWYVENRFVKKGVSQKRLRMELMKKGVDKSIIDEVLNGRDDTQEIRKMMAKKRGKYDDEKLIAYLCRQGFSYDLVRKIVEEDED